MATVNDASDGAYSKQNAETSHNNIELDIITHCEYKLEQIVDYYFI